jgi:hypothetical protein
MLIWLIQVKKLVWVHSNSSKFKLTQELIQVALSSLS